MRFGVAMGAAALVFLMPSAARAATLFVSPATGIFQPNQTFTVSVRMSTDGASVNAAEGALRFDPSRMYVSSVSTGGSVFNLNVQEPSYSNTDGTVSFAGVILNPGYTGASGTLLTISFRAKTPGTATLNFRSGAVLANDGRGTNVLTAMNGGTYTVLGAPAGSPPPAAAQVPASEAGERDPSLPDVSSPTHPDPNRWYSDNDPRFSWLLPSGVDGVSWLIHEKPDANPGNQLDGLVSEVSFTDLTDGPNYFHIKFRKDGAFGPIAHFLFNTDTEPPLAFSVDRVESDDVTNPRPQVVFATTDATSAVQQYRMRIGEGDWFDVPESPEDRPFRLPSQAPGAHEVTVEAIDSAGLATSATLLVAIESITVPVIESYPAQVSSDESFRVAGSAEPGATVTLTAYRPRIAAGQDDEAVAEQSSLADPSGRWEMVLDGLATGTYRLGAVGTDVRGAVSYPSETVTVQAGSWLGRQMNLLPGRFSVLPLLFRILVVLALAGLVWLVWLLFRHYRGHVGPDSLRGARSASKLAEVIADMESELDAVAHLGRSRPLYPEERHLVTKLSGYRTTLKRLVRSAERKSKMAK